MEEEERKCMTDGQLSNDRHGLRQSMISLSALNGNPAAREHVASIIRRRTDVGVANLSQVVTQLGS